MKLTVKGSSAVDPESGTVRNVHYIQQYPLELYRAGG